MALSTKQREARQLEAANAAKEAALKQVADLEAKVATLSRHPQGSSSMGTPARDPSASGSPPREDAIQEVDSGSGAASEEQREESGFAGGSDSEEDSSDDDSGGLPSAIPSGIAEDTLAGIGEYLSKSGSAEDNGSPLPPVIAEQLASILGQHSKAGTTPLAWAMELILPANASQVDPPCKCISGTCSRNQTGQVPTVLEGDTPRAAQRWRKHCRQAAGSARLIH